MTDKEKISYAKLYSKFNARIERFGRRLFYQAMKKQVLPLTEYLKKSEEITDGIIDSLILPEPIREGLSNFYKAVAPKFLSFFNTGRQGSVQPVQGVNIAFRDQQKLNELAKLAESQEVGQKIKDITNTTRQLVKDTIRDGYLQGKTRKEIIRDINTKTKGQITLNRASLISRTESTYISSKAAEVNTMHSPFPIQKEWIPIVDFRTRDAHAKMNNKSPIPKDDLFNVGGVKMKYPGDPAGGAYNCCNCRCVVHYSPIIQQETPAQEPINNLLLEQLLADLLK